jgi:dinuclear metal center YbgI/SA1388 family protein
MTNLQEILEYTHRLLEVDRYSDYCPNGLQVAGGAEVRHLVSGVTASLALLEAAVERGAQAVLVHHGYFWRGEDPCITGMKRRRLRSLLVNDISLLAYHLPLDAHLALGNNAQLAGRLGFTVDGRLGQAGAVQVGMYGTPAEPLSGPDLARHIARRLGRSPLHIPGRARRIRRVGWCTGAAQGYLHEAVEMGLDAYISGEVSEQTVHEARECGVHYFGAGHHATERYGVQALGNHLAERFALSHEFIDIDNPV